MNKQNILKCAKSMSDNDYNTLFTYLKKMNVKDITIIFNKLFMYIYNNSLEKLVALSKEEFYKEII